MPDHALFEEIMEQGHVDEPLLSVTIERGIIRQEDLLANFLLRTGHPRYGKDQG
jgi:type I restriction enzyme S subunit